MKQIDKQHVFTLVLQQLEQQLKVAVESAFEAKEASTNEEAKAENKYDTRGLEASYLASGQAKRAQELQESIYNLKKVQIKNFSAEDPINVGALVEVLVNEKNKKFLFLLPVGGVEVDFEGVKLQSLTIDAPLGQSLFGMREGDEFELGPAFYEVIRVI